MAPLNAAGAGNGTAPRCVDTGMRKLVYAAAMAALSAVAGCAAAVPSAPAPAPSASSISPAPVVTVTEADAGRTVALRPGQRLEVYLHGAAQNLWSQPAAAGPALEPAASGKLSLPVGVTGAAFQAVRSGSARITATRSCPDPSAGQVACQGVQSFDLTVTVD